MFMPKKLIVPLIVVALVIAGGSFFGGMVYGKSQAGGPGGNARGARTGMAAFGGGVQGQGRNAGGFISGDIVSKDATSLTVKTRDGSSKIVFFATSTKVSKMADGSMDDLAPGTTVTVMGTTNTDGSVTASQLQIRPVGLGGPGEQPPGAPNTPPAVK